MIGTRRLIATQASGAFSDPSDYGSDLKLWLDASDSGTISATGGLVDTWTSKDPNSRAFTGTTTSRPTTGATTQNTLNVVDFDGGDNLIGATASHWNFLHDGTDYVVAVVARITSTTGGYLGNMEGASTQRGVYFYKGSNTATWHVVQNGTAVQRPIQNLSAAAAGTAWAIVTVFGDPDNGTAADRSAVYVNGGTANQSNTNTNAVSASNATHNLHIGSLVNVSGVPAFWMTGSIAEIVIVSGASATETERGNILDYLNTKWAVY